MREAPILVLASRLLAEGAEVRAWDPVADAARPAARRRRSATRRSRPSRGADAAVIVTEWPELARARSRRGPRRDAQPADRRRPQPARPGRRRAPPASPTRASGGRPRRLARRPRRPSRASGADGGDHPRRRQGRAARRRRRRAAEVARPGRRQARSPRTRSRGSCAAGVDARDRRAARAGQGPLFDGRARGPRRRDRRRRGARAARSRRRAPLRGRAPRGGRRRLRAERRRAASTSTSRALLARHRATRRGRDDHRRAARRRRSASSTSPTTTRVTGFQRGAALPHWVNCGVYVLGEEALARLPERGDHETTTFPELAAEGKLLRLPARGPLADREHAEGPAPRRGARRRAPRLAGGACVSLERVRASSPAGREAVGLRADLGAHRRATAARCSSSARARRSRSSTTSGRTSRGYVQQGRAELELGRASAATLETRDRRPGRLLPLRARHRPPRARARGHDDRSRSRRPHLDDVVRLEDATARDRHVEP